MVRIGEQIFIKFIVVEAREGRFYVTKRNLSFSSYFAHKFIIALTIIIQTSSGDEDFLS